MVDFAKNLSQINIEDEMKESYLAYAMSVIVGRALPDARDGLKPVHRRSLFAMHEQNNDWNKPYKKSARIVGDVMGKYHPHGDSAIYDTIVRMAQPFSLRYMLVDGQGNFGSVDGDSPAAMRYTEVRMAKIAHELLADIDKETVDFSPNYDESEHEPTVFPTRIPNLLINGSSGIAVGMATNIPPHNLTEVINACVATIDNPDIDIDGLMEYLPGPDFPTAGIINGAKGIREAYHTGRGRVHIRSRIEIEGEGDDDKRLAIVVRELPYQVNKARLIEKIAELVKEKKIEGIRPDGLRDESDKDGMRLVIELKKGESPEVLLNNLYKQTQMQVVFGINCVALVDNQPRLLNLKQLIDAFIRHRREVVTRRTIFDLRKAREKAHILEGLAVALANIDPVIELIKKSANPAEAKTKLLAEIWAPGIVTDLLDRAGSDASRPDGLGSEFGLTDKGYQLSEVQAQAILELRLHRLTGLEQEKIVKDYKELIEIIDDLLDILERPERLMTVIRDELVSINEQFGDERRTEILDTHLDLSLEDLITEEDMVVTLSHAGYAKAQSLELYRSQRRGGKGKSATQMKEEDFVDQLFIANTHDTILCFSSQGKLYWKKVYELPQAGRNARGKPIVNLLPLDEDEKITSVLPVKEFTEDQYVFMATASGTVKKTSLMNFSRPRANGIIAVDLDEDDQLVGVALTSGSDKVMLFNTNGKAICFDENDVRPMGRTARGVRGIRLSENQKVISLIIVGAEAIDDEGKILTATENGFGKRTNIAEYSVQGRGGQGLIAIQISERNGDAIGAVLVHDDDEIMLISNKGTLVRTPVEHVSVVGRNTQGVNLITLSDGEALVGIERIMDVGDDEDETDPVADGENRGNPEDGEPTSDSE
ncbi:MAG: DNA gyrase subunit A [Gammaproteobacteria bacterium]